MASLPSTERMYKAIEDKDRSFVGVFYVAVKTTGIFCRPGCPARCPRRENVEFFADPKEALFAGYRPCKRCKPMDRLTEEPEWVVKAKSLVESLPEGRITEQQLRDNGLSPERLRRWFLHNHGMTFQTYQRGLRLGRAFKQIREGASVIESATFSGWDSTSGFRDAFQKAFGISPSQADGPVFAIKSIDTPLGSMISVTDEERLYLLEFFDRRMMATQMKTLQARYKCSVAPGETAVHQQLEGELREYFAGSRKSFSVPLDYRGTGFQVEVWDRLLRIGYGETLSYAAMARDLGRPDAQRAVGKANGDNRIAILVPCHRVVKADGTLCGYGGGLWRKRRLLDLEQGQLTLA